MTKQQCDSIACKLRQAVREAKDPAVITLAEAMFDLLDAIRFGDMPIPVGAGEHGQPEASGR